MRIPAEWASPCCAQFAVSKAAVLSKPLEFWERVRSPIMSNPEKLSREWWPGADSEKKEGVNKWNIGVAYERTWHYFFGLDPITCLDEAYCENVIYQGKIHCDGKTSSWEKSQDFAKITCTLDDDY